MPTTPPASIDRRDFLARAGALSAAAAGGLWLAPRRAAAGPGPSVAEAFDAEVERFMSARKVPGGALAVVRGGRLVHARGYGLTDRGGAQPVAPGSLFRIASLSKPVTAAAVLKLLDAGRLELDAPVFGILRHAPLPGRGKPDPRLRAVTVRHCLQHTGGWDTGASGDPMFRSVEIAKAAGVPAPARQEHIIRHMLSRPLDFAPGTRCAYSNFGYCLLGRVIEQASGRPYQDYVREEVLAPIGIRGMRLGRTLAAGRAPGEVRYHMPDDRMWASVFASEPGPLPAPYGGFCLEAMDSHGGWLASAVDLARFAAAIDAPASRHWLGAAARRALQQPPAPPVSRLPDGSLADHFYAAGWLVRPVPRGTGANCWHTGGLPGTHALLVRRFDGLAWVALFNQRSDDPQLPDGALDAALHRAADAIGHWPDHDLFAAHDR